MLNFVNLTKKTTPNVPFNKIYKNILKTNFDISLVFIGHARSKTLNKKFRNKNETANILTFPISSDTAEIFITLPPQNVKEFNLSEREYITFLFIHGLLHLKGEKHGKEMEKKESTLLKKLL